MHPFHLAFPVASLICGVLAVWEPIMAIRPMSRASTLTPFFRISPSPWATDSTSAVSVLIFIAVIIIGNKSAKFRVFNYNFLNTRPE